MLKTYSKFWWLLLIRGIILIIVSFFVLQHPVASLVGLSIYLGIAILVTGISYLYLSISQRKTLEGWGWYLLGGIVDIIFGIILLTNPMVTASTLPIVIGFWAIFIGIADFINSFYNKKEGIKNWWIEMIGGIATVILGYFVLRNPLTGVFAITTMISLTLVFAGVTAIILAFQVKKLKNADKESSS